jgi:hypothetical protein
MSFASVVRSGTQRDPRLVAATRQVDPSSADAAFRIDRVGVNPQVVPHDLFDLRHRCSMGDERTGMGEE